MSSLSLKPIYFMLLQLFVCCFEGTPTLHLNIWTFDEKPQSLAHFSQNCQENCFFNKTNFALKIANLIALLISNFPSLCRLYGHYAVNYTITLLKFNKRVLSFVGYKSSIKFRFFGLNYQWINFSTKKFTSTECVFSIPFCYFTCYFYISGWTLSLQSI